MKTQKITIAGLNRIKGIVKTRTLTDLDQTITDLITQAAADGFENSEIEGFIERRMELAFNRFYTEGPPARMGLQAKIDYVRKFDQKMTGSLPSEAADWIDGINQGTDQDKLDIWYEIRKSLDWTSRDRRRENCDMPAWTNKK